MHFPNLKSYFIFHRETLSLGESHRNPHLLRMGHFLTGNSSFYGPIFLSDILNEGII